MMLSIITTALQVGLVMGSGTRKPEGNPTLLLPESGKWYSNPTFATRPEPITRLGKPHPHFLLEFFVLSRYVSGLNIRCSMSSRSHIEYISSLLRNVFLDPIIMYG